MFIPYKHWLSLLMLNREMHTCDYKQIVRKLEQKLERQVRKGGIRGIGGSVERWEESSYIKYVYCLLYK